MPRERHGFKEFILSTLFFAFVGEYKYLLTFPSKYLPPFLSETSDDDDKNIKGRTSLIFMMALLELLDQVYKRNLVMKKTNLALNSLTMHVLNL